MWGHYLALLIVITILIFPISWIYRLIHRYYGPEDALVSLVVISIGIIILGIRGGKYAYTLHRFVRDESERRTQGDGKQVVFEMFGIEFYQSGSSQSNPVAPQNETIQQDTRDDHDDLQDLISSGNRTHSRTQPLTPKHRNHREEQH